MNIITGYTGRSDHVTANADQGLHQGIFGRGDYVLDVGQKFAATMTDATTVTLADGEGVLQGVHFRIEPGTTESISVSPGTTGYNRIDLIVARYTKDVATGIEAVNLAVIEGTPTASTPTVPEYTEGDILAGDTLAEFPMFRVTLTGLTPAITSLLEYRGTIGQPINLTTLHTVSGRAIASHGTYTASCTVGSGTWVIITNYVVTFNSAIAAAGLGVDVTVGSKATGLEVFAGQTVCSGSMTQFVTSDAAQTMAINVTNATNTAGTLRLEVIGLRVA